MIYDLLSRSKLSQNNNLLVRDSSLKPGGLFNRGQTFCRDQLDKQIFSSDPQLFLGFDLL